MIEVKRQQAIVVGSGIAGIAGAIRLACKGYDVTVLEANSYPGGKLTLLQLGNYRFDAGPSLFTLPHLVDELFELAGKNPTDYFTYDQVETACHYFFEDGTFLRFFGDQERLLEEVKTKLQVDSKPLENHLKRSKLIYDATHKAFMERSLHRFSSYISTDILKCVAHIPWLNLFTTMHKANEQRLNHPKLVQLFDRYATYNGSNPYSAPGILNIIPHLEHGFGTFFPRKGMHSITTSLVQLAEELGVRFRFNERVEEIVVETNRVTGVRTTTTFYPAEIVLCNSDIKPAYTHLLKDQSQPKKTMAQEPSSSAMIFYWGIKQSFPQLDLHNIFFSEDYKAEFDAIFTAKTVSTDPTVYVHISSKKVTNDAPDGCENWFVMVNVPHNQGQDWEALRAQIRTSVLEKLSRILQTDIASLIVEEDYLDPLRIEERTGSFGGALYGASSNDRMAAFFRHPNFSKINGLYFAGGSVHPGGGIPLCLLSAKIATELVK
ncbi:MAG: phytoene desaturase family protein [Fluviicola sp.]|nr:phytoene desaturase family protein [Fluviicola sp.]